MGDDSPAEKKALIDYNVGVFQEALKQVFPRSEEVATPA
jgi:Ras-related GTP-binding protein C/D